MPGKAGQALLPLLGTCRALMVLIDVSLGIASFVLVKGLEPPAHPPPHPAVGHRPGGSEHPCLHRITCILCRAV